MLNRPPTVPNPPTFNFIAALTEVRELLRRDPLTRVRAVVPVRLAHNTEIFLPT